ncbi:SAM-dependent methyltransferase [Aporhodopirellula aestuarii]|uniref:Cyclopropane-fatty-acyl-phospholipid synthase family protein n=1 Tax=Aporhodopirellula aestuarii TaxID=2950107 RepID=A0ABT0U891_9BACT|nr:cyclopropane-fatty-acyl-phospholipid synthase family protein [Aporhodopirellula aestuarii]MCM2373174.1 cyclopropane-fatty-acyl-phospholipid synthase family protein [Aporhodopirellula aestuarii]
MGHPFSAEAQLSSIKELLQSIAEPLDLNTSVRLWNGEVIPLGTKADGKYTIELSGPGVIGSLIRRPTLETLVRLYATGHISFEGGDLIDFTAALKTERSNRRRLKTISKTMVARRTLPFLFAKTDNRELNQAFRDDMVGRTESKRDNKDYIQFHYDVSNEFYKLFLGSEVVYTCAYFKDWNNSLDQAQHDKLDMICRKLRLEPGEKMLDIGCGWGGLICHAAKHYGVQAHGVTLSQTQHDYAKQKIDELGLSDQVTVELCDYADHQGQYDKISSIGMSEHIGVANYPKYFGKINSMLRDRGIMLNHAIASRAKASKRLAKRIRPERAFILKYIFPGSELTPVGMTTDFMERSGFEVHDVESWREHYALTLKYWCKNLSANKEKAIELVGEERYRLWVAYLAGGSAGFAAGSIKIFQVVGVKRAAKGLTGMPPTREHLYRAA